MFVTRKSRIGGTHSRILHLCRFFYMEGKKSFILYCDIIHNLKELTNEEAGILFKHILSYVNDQNPILEDRLLKIAFEPIKQQLKRDLLKNKRNMAKREVVLKNPTLY